MRNTHKIFAMVKYLSQNFYTIDELSQVANTDIDTLEKMVEYNLIPRWTYEINCSISESSILMGTLSADDDNVKFFHKATTYWLERAKNDLLTNSNDYIKVSNIVKQGMKQKFYELFTTNKSICIGYTGLYDECGNIISSEFDDQFNFIYQGWCNGTYGICTKNPCDEKNIFYKAVYQTLLNYLTEQNKKEHYTEDDLNQVMNAVKQYDEYVSEFTPLSFDLSSRKKYINRFIIL